MNSAKSRLTLLAIVFATILLAGVAMYTAVKLYNLRKQSVTPTTPQDADAFIPATSPYMDFTCNASDPAKTYKIKIYSLSESPNCGGTVRSCPSTPYNITTYSTDFRIVVDPLQSKRKSFSIPYTKNSNFCDNACGDPTLGGSCNKNPEQTSGTAVLSTANNFTSEIITVTRSTGEQIACGTIQTDLVLPEFSDCPEVASVIQQRGYGPLSWGLCFTGVDCNNITPTSTPTNTPTGTLTSSPTSTPTNTGTPTPTLPPNLISCTDLTFSIHIPTSTPTNTPTGTLTNTPTGTLTSTPTNTPTGTLTSSPTSTTTTTPTSTIQPSTTVTTATVTPSPSTTVLPQAGSVWLTFLFGFVATFAIAAALLLAI